ncbi:arsenate reductase ArsC [Piscirickettsia litoralis]|uniref:Phosphotyrosine protein phosphatase I domain-containing protein n=1 Tax=Piscirickettsia litoralis TaxID=1891921 RepID=A0ABX3A8A2_9GAMM|nr:arsenate reductase ArsC [Piscirickettsia litoralis]ODN43660.1 hypothetical protein BGC07_13045 [Piscirickettsia litoralis]
MNILFLCVANSARSQMAEGIAKNIFKGCSDINVQSAGSKPASVHPLAIKVLQEMNIDISKQYSKSVADIDLSKVDYIITLCADEICPYVASPVVKEHWPFEDPAQPDMNSSKESQLGRFRKIRDLLKRKYFFIF